MDISAYKHRISQLCITYDVKRLMLFGSATRSDFDPTHSDIDFLVEFVSPHPSGAFDRYFGLKESLEKLFRRPVDLVEQPAIKNPYFRAAIEQEKVLVYGSGN